MFRPFGAAAGIGGFGLAAALITAPAIAQAADDRPGSFAEGQFLAGTVLGSDLAHVVALDPATAFNDGAQPVAEERNPFSATVLGELAVDPGPIEVSDANGVDAGVIGQYAIARDDGTSYASSGLLGANGAIGVSPASGSVAAIDLGALLGDAMPDALRGMRLEAAGIAAEAEATLGGVRGDYTLADARLVLDVPAVADAGDQAEAVAVPLERSLLELGGDSGPIASVVADLLASLGLDGLAAVDVQVDTDIADIVASIAGTVLRDDALTIDLDSGIVTVDLASLPDGAGLNDLAPGTELLGDRVIDDIVDGIDRLLGGYLGELETRLVDAVRDARVAVSAHISVLDTVGAGETLRTVTTPVTQVIDAVTGDVLGVVDPDTGSVTSLVPSVSGDLLGQLLVGTGPMVLLGGLPSVTTRVVGEVSTIAEPAFSTLETSADVAISGTLAGLRGGEAAHATANATVLGAPVALDAAVLVDGIADAVDAVLPGVGDDPIAQDSATDAVAGIADLAGLLSLTTNVQTVGEDGAFTQTALRAQVLGGQLATVDLANATVGPNAMPGGSGGGPGPAFSGGGELAFTGFALGLIVLIGVACVGLGATALWRSHAAAADAGVVG